MGLKLGQIDREFYAAQNPITKKWLSFGNSRISNPVDCWVILWSDQVCCLTKKKYTAEQILARMQEYWQYEILEIEKEIRRWSGIYHPGWVEAKQAVVREYNTYIDNPAKLVHIKTSTITSMSFV
jgi:hypothetical protein